MTKNDKVIDMIYREGMNLLDDLKRIEAEELNLTDLYKSLSSVRQSRKMLLQPEEIA